MENSVLKIALNKAKATAPLKSQSQAPRDNGARDEAFKAFILDFDKDAFKALPSHCQKKLESLANTIWQFLSNSSFVKNGNLAKPQSGFEMANFAIAKAIFDTFKALDNGFFNYATHDREVSQNLPLKTLATADLEISDKMALISQIIAELDNLAKEV